MSVLPLAKLNPYHQIEKKIFAKLIFQSKNTFREIDLARVLKTSWPYIKNKGSLAKIVLNNK